MHSIATYSDNRLKRLECTATARSPHDFDQNKLEHVETSRNILKHLKTFGLQADVAAAKSKPPDRETGRALLSLDVGNNPWERKQNWSVSCLPGGIEYF